MHGEKSNSGQGESAGRRSSLWPERVLRAMSEKSWIYLLVLWGLAFVAAIAGFWSQFANRPHTVSGIIYNAAQLLSLNAPVDPEPSNGFISFAAILVPILALSTALAAVAAIFKDKFQAFILHRYYEDHVVVCGLGRKGWLFVKEFRKQGERVVVIEKDENNERVTDCKNMLAMVLIGNAEDPAILKKAKVQNARRLICVCGEDGANAEIAVHSQGMVSKNRQKALVCLVHVFSPQLCNLLRAQIVEMSKNGAFRLEFFNIFQQGAWILLDESDPFRDKSGPAMPHPHLLVVGLGWLGENVLIQAAKHWRSRFDTEGNRLTFTVIDRYATDKIEHICARYPWLTKISELRSLKLEIESHDFHHARFLTQLGEIPPVTSIYICLGNQSLGLAAALTLHEKAEKRKIPIIVRCDHSTGLASIFPGFHGQCLMVLRNPDLRFI